MPYRDVVARDGSRLDAMLTKILNYIHTDDPTMPLRGRPVHMGQYMVSYNTDSEGAMEWIDVSSVDDSFVLASRLGTGLFMIGASNIDFATMVLMTLG